MHAFVFVQIDIKVPHTSDPFHPVALQSVHDDQDSTIDELLQHSPPFDGAHRHENGRVCVPAEDTSFDVPCPSVCGSYKDVPAHIFSCLIVLHSETVHCYQNVLCRHSLQHCSKDYGCCDGMNL